RFTARKPRLPFHLLGKGRRGLLVVLTGERTRQARGSQCYDGCPDQQQTSHECGSHRMFLQASASLKSHFRTGRRGTLASQIAGQECPAYRWEAVSKRRADAFYAKPARAAAPRG